MPQVTRVDLDEVLPVRVETTIEIFRRMSKMPHLQMLNCRDLPMNRAALDLVKSFKSLKKIKFDEALSMPLSELSLYLRDFPNFHLTGSDYTGWPSLEIGSKNSSD